MEQEIELARIDSQERQAKQDSETKFASELELEKLGVEKAAHARNPKFPYFEESKDRWIVTYQDLRRTLSQKMG